MHTKLGTLDIIRIEELCVPFSRPEEFLVGLPNDAVDRNREALFPNFIDPASGNMIVSFHSWILRTGRHNILIDACLGNHKNRPGLPPAHQITTPYQANLSAAGLTADQIDFVFCTHLHVDHVGWNTRLENGQWVPTFRNARYLFARKEFEFWSESLNGPPVQAFQEGVIEDSILPVFSARQAELVDDGFEIGRNIVVEAAAGHSPGHAMVRARTAPRQALFCGDVVHHPLQILHPEVNSFACMHPDQSRLTRRRVLNECASDGHVLFPAHFGAPHFGRVTANGERFAFHPGL